MAPCKNCEGQGHVEEYIDCGRTAAYCCGGCTRTVRCEECNGTGESDDDDECILE